MTTILWLYVSWDVASDKSFLNYAQETGRRGWSSVISYRGHFVKLFRVLQCWKSKKLTAIRSEVQFLVKKLFNLAFTNVVYTNLVHRATPQIWTPKDDCPVSWGCRIHWLHLCRGVRPTLKSVLDMTLNNLMVRFQQCWSFGECGVPLHCHRSQVHSGPEW